MVRRKDKPKSLTEHLTDISTQLSASSRSISKNKSDASRTSIRKVDMAKSKKADTTRKRKHPQKLDAIAGGKPCKIYLSTIKEIVRLQRTTKLCIPKLSFSRVIREIAMIYGPPDTRFEARALEALQEAAELYMTQFFEDSELIAFHARRVTVMVKDMQLLIRLRKNMH